ncbi:MAG: hypothetical protein C0484_02535 [Rhodospirillum sp.]|nr:hypothetical protein [Rhodospirillum sp.]
MPIKFTPIANKPEWAGSSWEIASDDALAKLVARVALGQSHYALRVLRETGFIGPKAAATTLPGAIALLTAAKPKDPYHRDGWLFQVISWIAAHLQEPDGLIMEPHMIHAHKGFDGLHVRMNKTTGGINTVVICEEKATKNARKMVRDHIWKEFEATEKGDSDHRLLSEVLVILKSRGGIDLDKAIEQLVWKSARAYRVAITVTDGVDFEEVFDGYGTVVSGDIARRRSEVLPVKDMRAWMQSIAAKAIKHAKELAGAHV